LILLDFHHAELEGVAWMKPLADVAVDEGRLSLSLMLSLSVSGFSWRGNAVLSGRAVLVIFGSVIAWHKIVA
jgi:hypothetical protein